MTQEEKQLLLKDLCARLPYHPILHFDDKVQQDDEYLYGFRENGGKFLVNDAYYVEEVKPYLRPMSSMTEEEKEEIAFIRDRDFQSVRKWVHDESIKETGNICPVTCGEIDYCNKKHLDYRGLIPMGLALEAPEGMYKNESL